MGEPVRLGVDAANIRAGGGMSHLTQLLGVAEPRDHGVDRVVVWAGRKTLERLPRREWLDGVYEPLLDRPLPQRLYWQRVHLPRRTLAARCRTLFAPGGSLLRNLSCPTVTMSRNLLPFDRSESKRFGLSRLRLHAEVLRYVQSRSFVNADGVIFLTEYSRRIVCDQLPRQPKRAVVIPHGVHERFRREPRRQKELSEYSTENPFRWVYVSFVKPYKHQWHVAEAVGRLRKEGIPVSIDFIGPSWPTARERLERTIRQWDPSGRHLRYLGPISFSKLHETYHKTDGFVFASSCENMPNILLEAMAGGLPIACSRRGPMPEVLGEEGAYFDPEDPSDIQRALRGLLMSPEMRERHAWAAHRRAQEFSWKSCASKTLAFISEIMSSQERTSALGWAASSSAG